MEQYFQDCNTILPNHCFNLPLILEFPVFSKDHCYLKAIYFHPSRAYRFLSLRCLGWNQDDLEVSFWQTTHQSSSIKSLVVSAPISWAPTAWTTAPSWEGKDVLKDPEISGPLSGPAHFEASRIAMALATWVSTAARSAKKCASKLRPTHWQRMRQGRPSPFARGRLQSRASGKAATHS